MKIGFWARKNLTELEHTIRKISLYTWYLLWLLFSPNKFFNKKPKQIKKIVFIDTAAALGDTLNGIGLLNRIKLENPELEIVHVIRNEYFPMFFSKLINLVSETDIRNSLKDSDIIFVYSLSDHSIKKEIEKHYNLWIGPYSIFSVFNLKKNFFVGNTFPTGLNHSIKEKINLVEKSGLKIKDYKLIFNSSKEHKEESKRLYSKLKLSKDKRLIILNPFSAKANLAKKESLTPANQWPLENYASLANYILKDKDIKIVIIGLKENKEDANFIINLVDFNLKNNIYNLCGELSFSALGELFKKAQAMVTIDTSCAHLASQVNLPVIDLMGSFDPKLYCAWNPSDNINESKAVTIFHPEVCCKCRRYHCPEKNNICMKSITVEEVYFILKKFLEEKWK